MQKYEELFFALEKLWKKDKILEKKYTNNGKKGKKRAKRGNLRKQNSWLHCLRSAQKTVRSFKAVTVAESGKSFNSSKVFCL